MNAGTWAVLAAVGTGVLGGFGYLLSVYLRGRVPWKKLEGAGGVVYFVEAGPPFDLAALSSAIATCRAIMPRTATTRWSTANLMRVIDGARVYVKASNTWLNRDSLKVAGETAPPVVYVGRDLKTLQHELGHLAQETLDKAPDPTHSRWAIDGLTAADAQFKQWLDQRAITR